MRINEAHFRIEPFDRQRHIRSGFTCGIKELDQYLHKQISQDRKRSITAPFVVCREDALEVLGLYTLSALRVELCSLPKDTVRKLPQYPEIPATRIGRLAVDLRWRGMRLGEYLLLDALHKSWQQSHRIGAFAVIVDATNDEARKFYAKYGFKTFPNHPNRLFLPMNIVKKIFPE